MKNKKGSVTLYLVFIIAAIVIVTIAAVLAPLGVEINSKFYAAGEDILLRANNSISSIQNESVRTSVQTGIGSGLGAIENNINVNNSIFQYSWILAVGLLALILFLYSRRMVEVGSSGGLI